MTSLSTRAFLLAATLAGSVLSQASDNTLRTLSIEGISFKLPPGLEWQSEIASNIAVKKDIKAKDQTYTVTAELIFAAEGFLEDAITEIEKKVKASKGDLKDFKVTRGEKFSGNPAVLVTYSRVRGEKGEDVEEERQYLFRRNNALYTWTERAHKAVQGQASLAFAAARSAVAFTSKDLSRTPKTWVDEAIKYTIPTDWEFEKVTPSKDPKLIAPIMHIETVATVKGQAWKLHVQMFAYKSPGSLDDVEKQMKEDVTRKWEEIQDFKIVDKQIFNGEKAIVSSFTGKQVPDKEEHAAPDAPRIRRRDFVMKRKGYLIRWVEHGPEATNPAIDAALKKARDGLSWL